MQDENNKIDELEQAYKQTISSSASVSSGGISNLLDEKQKLNMLLTEIDRVVDSKKLVVEKKLGDLKILKTEIEAGLEELKKLEAKKDTLQAELDKIEKLEADEKQIESEVANISNQI